MTKVTSKTTAKMSIFQSRAHLLLTAKGMRAPQTLPISSRSFWLTWTSLPGCTNLQPNPESSLPAPGTDLTQVFHTQQGSSGTAEKHLTHNTRHFIGIHPSARGVTSYFRPGETWSHHTLTWPLFPDQGLFLAEFLPACPNVQNLAFTEI